jgi:hypothetical protein
VIVYQDHENNTVFYDGFGGWTYDSSAAFSSKYPVETLERYRKRLQLKWTALGEKYRTPFTPMHRYEKLGPVGTF